MAHQYSVTVNNARLDSIETAVGTSPILRLLTGAAPANCAAATTGGTVCNVTLPSDWMAGAGSGVKAKTGTWSGTATASGTVGYYRIFDSGGGTCHVQGAVGVGSGELQLDNNIVNANQVITINTYQITAGNA